MAALKGLTVDLRAKRTVNHGHRSHSEGCHARDRITGGEAEGTLSRGLTKKGLRPARTRS